MIKRMSYSLRLFLNFVLGVALIYIFYHITYMVLENVVGVVSNIDLYAAFQSLFLFIVLVVLMGVGLYYKIADIQPTAENISKFRRIMFGGAIFMSVFLFIISAIDYFLTGKSLYDMLAFLMYGDVSSNEIEIHFSYILTMLLLSVLFYIPIIGALSWYLSRPSENF